MITIRQILKNAARIALICTSWCDPNTFSFISTIDVVVIQDMSVNYFPKKSFAGIFSLRVVSWISVTNVRRSFLHHIYLRWSSGAILSLLLGCALSLSCQELSFLSALWVLVISKKFPRCEFLLSRRSSLLTCWVTCLLLLHTAPRAARDTLTAFSVTLLICALRVTLLFYIKETRSDYESSVAVDYTWLCSPVLSGRDSLWLRVLCFCDNRLDFDQSRHRPACDPLSCKYRDTATVHRDPCNSRESDWSGRNFSASQSQAVLLTSQHVSLQILELWHSRQCSFLSCSGLRASLDVILVSGEQRTFLDTDTYALNGSVYVPDDVVVRLRRNCLCSSYSLFFLLRTPVLAQWINVIYSTYLSLFHAIQIRAVTLVTRYTSLRQMSSILRSICLWSLCILDTCTSRCYQLESNRVVWSRYLFSRHTQ